MSIKNGDCAVTDDRTSLELQMLKENLGKMEKQISELKYETIQLTQKYLEGFNNILTAQSENRSCDKQIFIEISQIKEKTIVLETTVDKLQAIDAYSEIKRFMEHAKNEKEVIDFMNITRDFMTTTQTNVKMLVASAVAISTVLIGMLFQFITKFLGGN